MNYYERIQNAIDFLENNLENEVKTEEAAKVAYMSVSNFYRLFFAITGYQVKEYLINRRISMAAEDIRVNHMKILDVAVKYTYSGSDAFTRIFRKITGVTPSACSRGIVPYKFERIHIMDKYFEIPDTEMNEQYPDIKVLKEMQPMRVAYYQYYGCNPEDGAFAAMKEWVMREKLDINNGNYRIFGYNSPDCDPSAPEYGYEVCVTIPDDLEVSDELVKTKELGGGLYAVIAIERNGDEEIGEGIMRGWKRFSKWLEGSKYVYGEAQWLEEHLGFGDDFEHIGGVELYMPVQLKKDTDMNRPEETEEFIEPFITAVCTQYGPGAEKKARDRMSKWMKRNEIVPGQENSRIFAFYNFEKLGQPDYCFRLYVQIPDGLPVAEEDSISKEEFPGGLYLKRSITYRINAQSWYNFIQKIETSPCYGFGPQPFMEEYLSNSLAIGRDTEVIQHMPVVRKPV